MLPTSPSTSPSFALFLHFLSTLFLGSVVPYSVPLCVPLAIFPNSVHSESQVPLLPLSFPLPAPVPTPLTAQCPQGRSHMFAQCRAVGSASPSTQACISTTWYTHTASPTPAAPVARPTGRPPPWPCTSAAPTASWRLLRRASRPFMNSNSSRVRGVGRR